MNSRKNSISTLRKKLFFMYTKNILAFRYYQHKMNLLSGASGTEKEDNPRNPIQKPENNGNTIPLINLPN